MILRTKFIATLLLLSAIGMAGCGGEEQSESNKSEEITSEIVSNSPNVTLGEQPDTNIVAQASAEGAKQLYIKTDNNTFVNANVFLPSSAQVRVIDEEYYGDSNALYKQIIINEPLEGLWVPAVHLAPDCDKKNQINKTCSFR